MESSASGKHEFLERKLQAVVLRQHKTQMALPFAFVFNQVERAGIRARNFARLGENQIEQACESRCEESATPISFSCSRSRSAVLQCFAADAFALGELDILESEPAFFPLLPARRWRKCRRKSQAPALVRGDPAALTWREARREARR